MTALLTPLFDPTTPPTPKELEAAGKLIVKDEDGKDVRLGSLYKDQKTVCIWIRNFYCGEYFAVETQPLKTAHNTLSSGLCQAYVKYLGTRVTPEMLEAAGVKLVIIGCGDSSFIKSYRAMLETPFPIYADLSKKTHIALGMTLRTLDQGGPSFVPEYLNFAGMGNILAAIMNAFRLGKLTAKPGDTKQLGGEFVMGPGNVTSFIRRMEHTKDHGPVGDLMAAAGVILPPSDESY